MTDFFIVRHGQSLGNAAGVFVGQNDIGLSELGHLQAEKTGEYLKSFKIDAVYTSDLSRAYDTARHICDALNMTPESDCALREINAGLWQGKSFDYLEENFENYKIWLKDIGNAKCDGGETVLQLQTRINSELLRISEKMGDKSVCVVTHAAPIRVMCCIWNSLSLSRAKDIAWVSNCSVTRVSLNNGTWNVKCIGYDSHLDGLKSRFPSNV